MHAENQPKKQWKNYEADLSEVVAEALEGERQAPALY
jgi:hypothetical protein